MKAIQFVLTDNRGNKELGEAYIIKDTDKLNDHMFLEHVSYDFSNIVDMQELVFVPDNINIDTIYLPLNEVEVNKDNNITYFKSTKNEYTIEVT